MAARRSHARRRDRRRSIEAVRRANAERRSSVTEEPFSKFQMIRIPARSSRSRRCSRRSRCRRTTTRPTASRSAGAACTSAGSRSSSSRACSTPRSATARCCQACPHRPMADEKTKPVHPHRRPPHRCFGRRGVHPPRAPPSDDVVRRTNNRTHTGTGGDDARRRLPLVSTLPPSLTSSSLVSTLPLACAARCCQAATRARASSSATARASARGARSRARSSTRPAGARVRSLPSLAAGLGRVAAGVPRANSSSRESARDSAVHANAARRVRVRAPRWRCAAASPPA